MERLSHKMKLTTWTDWGNVEDVGATVYVSQSFASSISASYSGGGEFGIWYQSDPSTIKCCRYDDVGGAQCKAQPDAGPLNNVHDGTGIAFHVDDAGHWHIWYQSNQPPYPIQEYYYGGEAWSIGTYLSRHGQNHNADSGVHAH